MVRRAVQIAASGVLLATAAPVFGSERDPADQHTTVWASAAEVFGLADRLVGRGNTRQAERVLALLARDPNADVRNEARYRLALLVEARGATKDAAVLLRRILDEKPDSVAVRLRLAGLLQKLGDEEAALRELRAVRTSDLPPDIARFVDRLSAALQASKPFGFQLEIALAPDSNINRATRSDTLGTILGDFSFNRDAQAKSEVGLALRAMAHARMDVANRVTMNARVSADSNLYRQKEFDDIVLDVAAGPEWRLANSRLAVEAGASQQWVGMSPYQHVLRLVGSVVQKVDAVSQLRLDAGPRWANNVVNDLEDGHGWFLRTRYDRAFSNRLSAVASLGFDRFKARDPAYSTRSWSMGLTAYREIGRMTWSVGTELGRLEADERLALLPRKRQDKLIRFQIGAVFRQLTFAGFAPITRVIFERNKSTVEFYHYERVRAEIGLSRAF